MDYDSRNNSHKRPRSRSRSRSRSPDIDENPKQQKDRAMEERERLDMERRKRMARLRAENEAEEKKMAAVDQAAKIRGEGGEYFNEQPLENGDSNKKHPAKEKIIQVDEEELEGLDEEEQMQKLFGFGGFASTKGKSVEDNQSSASRGVAAKNKARKYRQYMNRKGGFNRPLDKMN